MAGGSNVMQQSVLWASAGIACIFTMNLSVSFAMALTLALRARDIGVRESLWVFRRILFRFLRHPTEFLLPPGRNEQEG